jgi:penicillin amidase
MRARVTLAGETDCVLATSSVPGVSDACWRGPVARYVWDLTNRADSRWIVPFGASGRPADPHFDDQLPLWADGGPGVDPGLISSPDAPRPSPSRGGRHVPPRDGPIAAPRREGPWRHRPSGRRHSQGGR